MENIRKTLEKIKEFFANRYLILSIITCFIAVIYIGQLVNIQIVNGKEYREKSEKRMLRTETIVAPRGEIYDRNGVVLATSKLSYNVELYKVRVEAKEQNQALQKLIQILESNGDKISSSFPVNDTLNGFNFSNGEAEKKWKEEMKLEENASFDQVIDAYIKKYDLQDISDRNMQIKIIQIKYEGALNAYSLFNSATIAKDVSETSVAKIEERKSELYGVNVISTPKRYYPNANLTSHVVGYASKISNTEYEKVKDSGNYNINSVIGKTGIEQAFEFYLKGKDGTMKSETDAEGNISSETIASEPVSGKNVTLTIDYRLQKVAEDSLEAAIRGLKDGTLVGKKVPEASAGSVVVLDTENSEVLAMANYPNYDTNNFVNGIKTADWDKLNNDPLGPMNNRAISSVYSPGSTYKMLVGLAGLMSGGITVDEKILDPGIYPYGHHPKCWIYTQYHRTHGWVNISQAIKGSCNCFFYEVGRRIGIQEIIKYSKEFGLGQKTGIELSNEATGSIAGDGASEWYLGQTLSAAIGQAENAYTPIQMANYIATIANGGNLNKVSLIKQVTDEADNASVPVSELEEYSKNFTGVDFKSKNIGLDPKYINAVKEGMLSVTSETGGTANIIFKNSDIQVAGKTGTSQVAGKQNNGIFVGFAPYDKPKIAVVAIIEGGGEGTYTAHVVRPIMEEYFQISTQDKANEKAQNVATEKVSF